MTNFINTHKYINLEKVIKMVTGIISSKILWLLNIFLAQFYHMFSDEHVS